MFFHGPEHAPMSFTVFPNHFVVGYRIFEVRTWYLPVSAVVSEISRFADLSLLRFLPHLLMDKYHVLSMKYFVAVTLFVPK